MATIVVDRAEAPWSEPGETCDYCDEPATWHASAQPFEGDGYRAACDAHLADACRVVAANHS